MKAPSIKGAAFQSAVADVNHLLEEGRIRRDELEARLDGETLALLDEKPSAALWYPMESYCRLVEVLVDVEGGADPEGYLIERGRRAAERLAESGLYAQLDATHDRFGQSVGRFMASLAPAMYNFTRWEFSPHPSGRGGVALVYEAEGFPELARLTALGFIRFLASRATGRESRVTSERPTPDHIRFEIEIL